MIKLNLNVVRPNDIASGKASLDEAALNSLALQPQLAFDPKLASAEELFSYASQQWRLFTKPLPFYAEEKVDGVRCQFVLSLANGLPTAKAYSRANRELASVSHLLNDLVTSRDNAIADAALDDEPLSDWLAKLRKQGYDLLVIDCELFAVNADGSYLPFRLINGLANRHQPDSETASLKAYVFQCYWANSRGRCTCTVDPSQWQLLLFSQLRLSNTRWVAAKRYEIGTAESLRAIADKLAALHCEGLVLKSTDFRHFNGRTKQWLKLKFRRTGTFRLIEVLAGEGKCLGNAGAIRIRDASGSESLVGTGFTDSDRAELSSLNLTESGPIFVEVSYMTRTGDSLREASYQGIRYDLPDGYIATDLFLER